MSKYSFPKIDLHLHLDGSMLPESAWEMAAERGIALPADTLEGFRHFIVVTADCRSVNEYLKRFEMPLQILQDRASLERTAYELVCLLAGQGLRYAEIRFAPQLHLRKELTQRDAVEAVLTGVKRGMAERPSIDIGVLLCAMCVGEYWLNMDANLQTVREAARVRSEGVVGIDLAGAEGLTPLSGSSTKRSKPALPDSEKA